MFKESFLSKVAKAENVKRGFLEKRVRSGLVVIPLNKKRALKYTPAIGQGLKVKINTNIGVSTATGSLKQELEKVKLAVKYGSDTIMDLSVGSGLGKIRRQIMADCPVPFGTVPMYEIASEVTRRKGCLEKMGFDDIWDVLKRQAADGVDFFTIHSGILQKSIKMIQRKKRVCGIVSRGGAMLARWMYVNKQENPLYTNFDKILDLAKAYNITISLGDALRPGAIADSTDRLQIDELKVLGQLVKRCWKRKVQVMVEGPGHIRYDQIPFNMRIQKKLCHNAPFYILGPLTTDLAAGHDHISAAIGGTLAAFAGADFLCVVTPAEHLRHPSIEDIKDGVIAAKIAAHSVDLLRFRDELKRDRRMSLYRARRDWPGMFSLALDKEKAVSYRGGRDDHEDICTMCGEFCSLKLIEKCGFLK